MLLINKCKCSTLREHCNVCHTRSLYVATPFPPPPTAYCTEFPVFLKIRKSKKPPYVTLFSSLTTIAENRHSDNDDDYDDDDGVCDGDRDIGETCMGLAGGI